MVSTLNILGGVYDKYCSCLYNIYFGGICIIYIVGVCHEYVGGIYICRVYIIMCGGLIYNKRFSGICNKEICYIYGTYIKNVVCVQ